MMTTDDFDAPSAPPFLATAALRQRLDLLGHLLEFGHQIVLVQGAPGSGRSRLLEALGGQYRANWRIIPCVGEGVASAPALLDAVAAALEMSELNPGVEDLRSRMAEIELGGQFCIMTLDDGEALDEAARALLFALAYSENQRGDLRVVMTGGNDGFAEALQAAAPEGAVIHVVDLPPMDVEELKTLALSALTAEGGDAALDLSLDIDELAQDAQGNPGRLLAALRAPALPPISPGKRSTAPSAPTGGAGAGAALARLRSGLGALNVRKYAAVLAALAFVLVAVAVGVLLVGQHSRNSQPGTVEITLPTPGSAPPAASPASEPGAEPEAEPSAPTELPQDTAAAGVAETASSAADTAPASVADAPAEAPTEMPAPRMDASPAPESLAPAVAAAPESPATSASAAAPSEPPVAAPAPPPVVKEAPAAPVQASASTDKPAKPTTATAQPKAKPVTKPAAKPAPAKPAPAPVAANTDAWLAKQKPGSYVVQLFGSRDREAAHRFVRQQGLTGKSNVVGTRRDGAPWYVVVTGPYATRVAAAAAIRGMAPALQKQKPWPRATASLK